MDQQEVESKVIDIVAEQMGVDKGEINRDTDFINDLNADSLDTVELVMEFEDEFETSIPDEEAEKIKTVGRRATASRRSTCVPSTVVSVTAGTSLPTSSGRRSAGWVGTCGPAALPDSCASPVGA